jgi:putative cell wall-binding protein
VLNLRFGSNDDARVLGSEASLKIKASARLLTTVSAVAILAVLPLSDTSANAAESGVIRGSVQFDRLNDGNVQPWVDGYVRAHPSNLVSPHAIWGSGYTARTDAEGHYELVVPAGEYVLCFLGNGNDEYDECWGGGREFWDTDPFRVGAGQTLDGIDGMILGGAYLLADVMHQTGIGAAPQPAPDMGVVQIRTWDDDPANRVYFGEWNWAHGHFIEVMVPVGSYEVLVGSPTIGFEYLWEADFPEEAARVEVTTPGSLYLPPVVIGPPLDTIRLTGADRFETSVVISRQLFPGVPTADQAAPVVYVVNGLNYPDALAAGPAAIEEGGVILLATPWFLPDVVRSEVIRLHPERIVVVGGNPSIGSAVYDELEGLAPEVLRVTGADRFETSRDLAAATFGTGSNSVFIATGLNYPDALAAGPAAGHRNAPLLLVNGLQPDLDVPTAEAIDGLGATEVFVIGGIPSVSAGIVDDLEDRYGAANVHRITGSDRFGTAAEIYRTFFVTDAWTDDVVYAATGLGFPDALAGAPLAGSRGAGLLLARPDCIPTDAQQAIAAAGTVRKMYVLGGEPSLGAPVMLLHTCA